MTKKILLSIGGIVLSATLTGVSYAQDVSTKTTTTTTVTKTVQNPDGSYTVVQYPVGKEVVVDLAPGATMSGAKGLAHIMRMGDQTTVNLDLSGLPADASSYYVYAVDPSGAVTLLGPAAVSNGASTTSFKTPMDKFMLVLSPTEGLNAIGSDTPVVFRSSIPKGYAVVPTVMRNEKKQDAQTMAVNSPYDVPLLGVSNFKRGTTKTIIKFGGDLQGVKGEAYITPTKGGSSKIVMGFGDMKNGPLNTRFVLWAVSPDGRYTKLGQVINTGRKDHAEIRSETMLPDFGLFVTVENTEVNQPSGKTYAPFRIG